MWHMEMTVLIDMYSRLLTVQDRARILKYCGVIWYVIVSDGDTMLPIAYIPCYFKVFPKTLWYRPMSRKHCLTMIYHIPKRMVVVPMYFAL